ncbi:hypothetical protein FZC35_00645 [Candidatus Cytomitobacter indipagum]|uniref:Uncharacterized protein n=1 Tax=Candidatus Cytomitobacter indipagum TaxID=2601575 RepID=A0A5C0UFR9_9PROT|nr:hypothetical protein [Candidatus Cytomitobacter indipagum]QEK37894.1 hypothetical protein FZC35_00645 [Candidatus Cytomitobacter indipagum]
MLNKLQSTILSCAILASMSNINCTFEVMEYSKARESALSSFKDLCQPGTNTININAIMMFLSVTYELKSKLYNTDDVRMSNCTQANAFKLLHMDISEDAIKGGIDQHLGKQIMDEISCSKMEGILDGEPGEVWNIISEGYNGGYAISGESVGALDISKSIPHFLLSIIFNAPIEKLEIGINGFSEMNIIPSGIAISRLHIHAFECDLYLPACTLYNHLVDSDELQSEFGLTFDELEVELAYELLGANDYGIEHKIINDCFQDGINTNFCFCYSDNDNELDDLGKKEDYKRMNFSKEMRHDRINILSVSIDMQQHLLLRNIIQLEYIAILPKELIIVGDHVDLLDLNKEAFIRGDYFRKGLLDFPFVLNADNGSDTPANFAKLEELDLFFRLLKDVYSKIERKSVEWTNAYMNNNENLSSFSFSNPKPIENLLEYYNNFVKNNS